VSWFICYETTNLVATWGEAQRPFISRFSDARNERQAIVALRQVKQWKHETMEDYYDIFTIIPQQLNDVYL
jgi:hypothetical protein